MLTSDQCYQAVTGRDRRFDGMFFTAVATTRIFCRPSCPARTRAGERRLLSDGRGRGRSRVSGM